MWHALIKDTYLSRTAHLDLVNEMATTTNVLMSDGSWVSVQQGSALPTTGTGIDIPLDALESLYHALGRFLRLGSDEEAAKAKDEQIGLLKALLESERRRVGDLHGEIVRSLHHSHPEPVLLSTATTEND